MRIFKYIAASVILIIAASCAGRPGRVNNGDGAGDARTEIADVATDTPETTEKKAPAAGGTKVIQKIKYKKEYDTVVAEAEYPLTGIESIDAKIKEFIDSSIKAFVENDGAELFREDVKNGIFITFDPYSGFRNIMSFRFNVSVYTGGAHPINAIVCKNYDRTSSDLIELGDVFRQDTEYIKKISEIAIADLIENSPMPDPDISWIRDGAGPDPENYDLFTLDGDKIVFHFDTYQVAPYAEGIKEVAIAFEDIKEFLKPGFAQ